MKKAFTVIELLVVIVIIGILASLIVTSYVNITQKASIASLQSDLSNAGSQLKLYYAQFGNYPTSMNCTNTQASEICLKNSPGNTLVYTQTSSNTFQLNATNGSGTYYITEALPPTLLPASPVVAGLILNYDAKNTASFQSGNTTWNDLTSNANNATLNGVTYSNSSLYFNSNYTRVANITSAPAGNMTLETWIKMTSLPTANGVYLAQLSRSGTDSDTEFGWTIGQTGSVGFWDYSAGFGFNSGAATSNLSINTWYLLDFVKNGTSGTFYINGSSAGTITAALNASYGTNDFVIGQDYRDLIRGFVGYIDVFRMYNTSLSASDVTQNFNAIKSRYGY